MASTDSLPILDHIVILVSESDLGTISDRLSDTFTISPGGEHSSGHTFNKLILFQDGVYIELIAFYDKLTPEERKSNRWGHLKEGSIIDWAYTLDKESNFTHVQRRVEKKDAGITYNDPWNMGRTRPDGVELKWSIGAARKPDGSPTPSGSAPFWCLDQTERKLRVPYEGNEAVNHPSGALGVSRVEVTVPSEDYESYRKVYDGIHDGDGVSERTSSWKYLVHSRKNVGKQTVSLIEGSERSITITFAGGSESRDSVEILPGLTVKFDKDD